MGNANALPRFKVIEVHRQIKRKHVTDFLVTDEGANEMLVILGQEGVYCIVENRMTADMVVNALNFMPAASVMLTTAFRKKPAEAMAFLREAFPDIAAQADQTIN